MALPSLWSVVSGVWKEILFGTTGGSVDANKPVAYDNNGTIPLAGLPAELQPNIDTFTATEAIAAGAFVTLVTTVNAGVATTTIKNAVAAAYATRAFAHVKEAVATNTVAKVFFLPDKNTAVSLDATKLGDQWLSPTTAGATTNVPPTGAGIISQYLGYATSATTIHTVSYPALVMAQ